MINKENVQKAAIENGFSINNGIDHLIKFIEAYNKLQEKACSDPEAWREEYRKKQAAGVKFEFNGIKGWTRRNDCMFDSLKENYREVVGAPKPTIPHLESRKLWLAQREVGTNEVWQYSCDSGVTWDSLPVREEPCWTESVRYRVKPKTEKRYMAMARGKGLSHYATLSGHGQTAEEFKSHLQNSGWKMIGDIVERELEIGND